MSSLGKRNWLKSFHLVFLRLIVHLFTMSFQCLDVLTIKETSQFHKPTFHISVARDIKPLFRRQASNTHLYSDNYLSWWKKPAHQWRLFTVIRDLNLVFGQNMCNEDQHRLHYFIVNGGTVFLPCTDNLIKTLTFICFFQVSSNLLSTVHVFKWLIQTPFCVL